MAFSQEGDDDVNVIPAVKRLCDSGLLKHCQVTICERAQPFPPLQRTPAADY